MSSDDLETRFYLRVHVHDAPGVLAQIALVLGEHNVSIAGVSQKESDLTERTAELVIMTHPTVKRSFDAALREIEQLPVVNEIRQHLLVEQ
ncbi:MAG: ACT domain-containing protein [Dehalococcoidia bacterium]|nr:ACT domain-containing protein [Dehalococcoidia bacterium]